MTRVRTLCLVLAMITVAGALGARQVPVQDRQPAGSALRPAVMGPSGGVSTGHPLTTAAAFGILLKGGNAFDAGVASLLAGGVLEQDLYSLGGEALVLVYPTQGRQGHIGRRAGMGAERRSTWTGISRARRPSMAQGWIRPSCRARCMPRSRCSNGGAR